MSAQLRITVHPPVPVRKRKRWWLLAAGTLLLLALLWAAPHIVAATALRDWVVARLFPQVDGAIASRSAALDWFSPVELRDVTVTDHNGKTILRVGTIRSQKTLLRLLLDPDQAGSFQVEQADLQLHVRGKEFNLEKVLPGYFSNEPAPRSGSSGRSGARSIAMEILDSTISQHDADTDRQVKIEMLRGKVNLAANSSEPTTVELHGTLVDSGADRTGKTPAGKIDALFHWLGEGKGGGEFKIESDGMTLAAVNPLLRRVGIDAELSGRVHGQCIYRWGTKAGVEFSEIDADIASEAIDVAAPWLSDDRVRLRNVELPCRLALVGSRVQIDKAYLTTDLGKATLAGTLDLDDDVNGWLDEPGCHVFADVDLAALANQLPHTLRLQHGTMLNSGRLQLNCTSQKTNTGTAWEGNLAVTPLQGTRGGRTIVWPETLTVAFRARKNAKGLPEIDRLRGDSRFLKIDGSGNNEQFRIRVDVDLEKLAEPVGQFVDLSGWQLRGQGWASLALRAEAENSLQLESVGDFKKLQVLTLGDPAVDWQAQGRWSAGQLHVHEGSLRTSVCSIHTSDLNVVRGKSALPSVTGKVQVQGEISRLRQWLAADQEIATPITGAMVAYIDLPVSNPPVGTVDMHLSDVVVGPAHAPAWREPRMRLWTQLRLATQDELAIERFYLESTGLACDSKGKLTDFSGARNLELRGLLRYDLEKLEPALQAYLGSGARISGADKYAFHLTGPLSSGAAHLADLSGEAELGWQQVRAYGSDIGPAKLKLRLRDGWLRADSVHASINGGKLHVQPSVRFEPAPMELRLRPGLVVEKARITPAMSGGVLGYAAPVLAGVSKIDGAVSLIVDAVHMPLAGPANSEFRGKLHVHNARFGATKLIEEIVGAFKLAAPSVQISECTVPVTMVDGKVYHEGLEFTAGEMRMRTTGWVAVNGDMNMLAELTVPERWLSKINPNLGKQTIKLPIQGTLGEPRVDQAALRAAVGRFTRDAAGELLQREIEERLKKLFKR